MSPLMAQTQKHVENSQWFNRQETNKQIIKETNVKKKKTKTA